MGWVESPPSFMALTETSCDLANQCLRSVTAGTLVLPAHRLESVASTPPPSGLLAPPPPRWRHQQPHPPDGHQPPLATLDVYVDDFILLAQTAHQRMRAALHSIDDVFRSLHPADPPHRKEPSSVKKLQERDGACSTSKTILGWDLNTVQGTLHLPHHPLLRLYNMLDLIQPPP